MRKKLLLYIKYFFVTGLMYAVLRILMDLAIDRETSWYDFSINFVIFGLGMSLAVVSFHLYSLRDLAKRSGKHDFNIEPQQSEKILSSTQPVQLSENLRNLPNFNRLKHDRANDHIRVETGYSGKSWGDRIDITYKHEGDNFKYEITSSPRFAITILDFGQNLENLLSIEKVMEHPG